MIARHFPYLFLMALAGHVLTGHAQAPTAPPNAVATAEPDLGRLFFSPERRNTLERQRQLNIREAQTLEGETLNLNGLVIRSSGKKTFWLNGRAQNDNDAPTGVTITPQRKTPGKAIVSASGETPEEVKVGETFNRATREKQSGLPDGSLKVKSGR